jgi:4-amino-4-deoxy-L-arabinose transferase-like glycosyltransferase
MKRTHLILLLIIALAAFLRLWQLNTLPPGLYHDEAYNGLDALSLVQGKTFPKFYEGWELYAEDAHDGELPTPTRWPLFFEGNYGREPLHIYLMALSVWLLGATPQAIRLIPALAGITAVWTTYLAAKSLLFYSQRDAKTKPPAESKPPGGWNLPEVGSAIPLLAAFFVAVLYPAVQFSRFGIRPMLFVPIETATVYFFWRGITQKKNRAAFLLAGFFLGLGIYTYAAARLFPLLFIIFVPIWFWRERPLAKHQWLNVSLMAGASLLTALPLLIFFIRTPYFFIFRIAYVANRGAGAVADKPWLTWLTNVGRVVRGLFWRGETNLRHNLSGRPYLDPIQAVLFILGVVRNGRFASKSNLRHIFLFIWLGVMLLPTILSGDAPHFGRMTGAVPAIAILMAMGLVWAWELFWRRWGAWLTEQRLQSLLAALFAAILLGTAAFTIRDYFGRYASHPELAAHFYLPDWQLGQFAAAQPSESTIYLSPTQEELATIYFALADPDRLQNYSGSGGVIPAGIANQPALYLLRPEETAVLQTLQSTFPEGSLLETPNDSFIAFGLPADAVRMGLAQETAVSFAQQISLIGWSATVEDEQLSVWLAWRAEQPLQLDYTAFVHLLGTDGQIVTQQDKPPAGHPTSDWRTGEIVLDHFVLPLPSLENPQTNPLTLQTGFYYLPTLDRLGKPFVLTPDLATLVNR